MGENFYKRSENSFWIFYNAYFTGSALPFPKTHPMLKVENSKLPKKNSCGIDIDLLLRVELKGNNPDEISFSPFNM